MGIGTINQYINQMSLRERVLLVVTIVSVVGMLLDMAFIRPLESKKRDVSARITSFNQQFQEINQRLSTVGGASEESGALSQIGDLKAEAKELSEKLSQYQDRLPQSSDSIQILKEYAQSESDTLELIALKNIIPKKVHQSNLWYRHGLMVRVRGEHEAITDYVKTLEGLSKQMAWETLFWHQVGDGEDAKGANGSGDTAEVTLETYTITDQPYWLMLN